MDDIIKQFSDLVGGRVIKGTDAPEVESIPTGLPSLDQRVFGCGGLPRGRITEAVGWESSGKSTFGYFLCACAHRGSPDAICMIIDLENSFVPSWAQRLGVDLDRTILPAKDRVLTMEEVLDHIKAGIALGIDYIMLDSIPALTPSIVMGRRFDTKRRKQDRASEEDGLRERRLQMNEKLEAANLLSTIWVRDLMNGFMYPDPRNRKKMRNYRIGASRTALYFTNQFRTDVDKRWGNKDISVAGNALKFLVRMKIKFAKVGSSTNRTEDGAPLFNIFQIDNVKNSVAAPFHSTEMVLERDGTVRESKDFVVRHAISMGVVEQKGSWFETKWGKAQGVDKVYAMLMQHKEELDLASKVERYAAQTGVTDEEKEQGKIMEIGGMLDEFIGKDTTDDDEESTE